MRAIKSKDREGHRAKREIADEQKNIDEGDAQCQDIRQTRPGKRAGGDREGREERHADSDKIEQARGSLQRDASESR